VGLFILVFYLSKLNFIFKKIASPFSFGQTCGCSDIIPGSLENQNFENSYNSDHWCLFHHIDPRPKVSICQGKERCTCQI
jgi:hypothetical protein